MKFKKIQIMLAAAFFMTMTIQSCSKKDGCTEVEACNYDPDAEENDGSCTFATTWYADADGDGLGNPGVTTSACDKPAGYVDNSSDGADLVVSAKQRAVVTYVGATWCPPCGAYGDPTKEHMESAHGSDVIILNVQSGDAISSSSAFGPKFGSAFQTSVGSNSIPHAYWSGANFAMEHRGFYTSASGNNNAADNDINAITGNSPEVGVDAQASISGSTVTVQTLSKFYNAASTHYIGVYLLEDNVEALQKISGAAAAVTAHHNVLRASAYSGNSLGAESMGSSFTANQEVNGTYTITVPSSVENNANLQVAVVIWEANQADGISNGVIVDVK